jgi:tRNA(Arg) A34 adenosine deaminase TadA
MSLNRYFQVATRRSLEGNMCYKIGACIVSAGKIIAEGHNDNIRSRYGKDNVLTCHAEASCLYKLRKHMSTATKSCRKDR